ncbi:MAG: DUF3426 domain-containing protein [Desulfatiglandales bacterium]|nr:DUF3426 domain-containing protein [Desulfatiglandales bacterium]
MIIECDKCNSKYNLDANNLEEKGSKVRCSVCKYLFMAYPPKIESSEERAPYEPPPTPIAKTISLDISAEPDEEEAAIIGEEGDTEMDRVFESAIESTEDIRNVILGKDDMEETEDLPTSKKEMVAQAERERGAQKVRGTGEPGPTDRFKKKSRSFPSPLSLWIILVLLGSVVAIYFWAPGLIPDSLSFLKPSKKDGSTDIGVRRLSFKSVTGSFVKSNEEEGSLFAIKGIITNNYPNIRSFISIKGSILDDRGQVVKSKVVFAGNIFTEKQIKGLPMEDIDKGLDNRYGKGRINFKIEPDRTVPFMIIFDKLSENISEFTVEAVSSKTYEPGKPED